MEYGDELDQIIGVTEKKIKLKVILYHPVILFLFYVKFGDWHSFLFLLKLFYIYIRVIFPQ